MIFVIAILLEILVIEASHFRGGTVSWRHVRSYDGDIQEVEVFFRLGWRKDFSSPQCDDLHIAKQTSIYGSGDWAVDTGTGSRTSTHSVAVKCTTFDDSQNWAYGFNSFSVNVSETNPFDITFTGGNWISTLVFGANSGWSVRATTDKPGIRSDTGGFNRPPSTFSAPVVRLQTGCPSDIKITYSDDDNDNVFCRYAVGTDECRGICGSYSYFTLNETTCILHYDGRNGTGLVPVALMLEDFPKQSITVGNISVSSSDFLSQIPLQIIVDISISNNCNVRPSFPPASIPEGATFALPDSGVFNETIYAYPSAPGIRITLFIILGPLGVQKSNIFYIGNNTYIAHVTWQPSPDQSGRHDVCYYAVDQNGKASEQRCFHITVAAVANICEIDNGGCSDNCIPLNGGGNICNCSNPCWELDSHGKTCVPRTNISCTGSEVEIYVDKCSTDKTVVAGGSRDYFSDSRCQSLEGSSSHELLFAPDHCGTGLELSATGVHYNVYVWIWENFDHTSTSSAIVRGEWRIVRLTCSLPTVLNLTASFLPLPSLNEEIVPENVVVPGLGNFLLYFDFFRSSSFLSSYTRSEYPLSVALNENIYFALRAEGRTGLELFVERCVAMSTPVTTPDTRTHDLILDGCIVDQTTTFYPSANAMEARFSFQAFEFESNLLLSRSNSAAFINCQIVMCDIAANNTRCKQGCVSARRKRSSDVQSRTGDDDEEEGSAIPAPLQSPPSQITRQIQFIFPEENRSASSDDTKWIIIGVCGVIVLFALYLVYRIVMARRGTPTVEQGISPGKTNKSFDSEGTLATKI